MPIELKCAIRRLTCMERDFTIVFMQTINQDIKTGQFHRAYLLYGEEDYLKLQYRDRLVRALTGGQESMNFSRMEGDDCDLKGLIDLAQTMPFFADHRCILIMESGFFNSSNDELAAYLETVPETAVLIFVEKAVRKSTRPFKAMVKYGYACEFLKPDERTLMQWIGGRLSKEKKTMSPEAWREFFLRSGENMENMEREYEKLVTYCLDRERIELDDVRAITSRPLNNRVFDLIDAMARRDGKLLLEHYADMIAAKEPPLRILSLIERQFIQMLAVRQMSSDHLSDREIGQKIAVSPYIVGKIRRSSESYSQEQIRQLLADASDMEERIKTGKITDRLGVEVLMMRYAR